MFGASHALSHEPEPPPWAPCASMKRVLLLETSSSSHIFDLLCLDGDEYEMQPRGLWMLQISCPVPSVWVSPPAQAWAVGFRVNSPQERALLSLLPSCPQPQIWDRRSSLSNLAPNLLKSQHSTRSPWDHEAVPTVPHGGQQGVAHGPQTMEKCQQPPPGQSNQHPLLPPQRTMGTSPPSQKQ